MLSRPLRSSSWRFRAMGCDRHWRVQGVAPELGIPVVSLSKGLEEHTNQRMSEVLAEVWPRHVVAVLTGPNLAEEVFDGQPTASVVATHDEALGRELQELFSSDRLRVYTNPDVVGCEISGVVKNVMAIACGMAVGLGYGDNTRAALITRSLAELIRLGEALGGEQRTFAGLAGIGDLVATCTSRKSRNLRVGVALGQGRPLAQAIGGRSVAEGVKSFAPSRWGSQVTWESRCLSPSRSSPSASRAKRHLRASPRTHGPSSPCGVPPR